MTIKIVFNNCTGCPNTNEPLCVKVCPGDLLIRRAGERAELRDGKDCWDCGACLKSCPNGALAMYLPVQIGGKGASLKAKSLKDKITWICKGPEGKEETFAIETEKII